MAVRWRGQNPPYSTKFIPLVPLGRMIARMRTTVADDSNTRCDGGHGLFSDDPRQKVRPVSSFCFSHRCKRSLVQQSRKHAARPSPNRFLLNTPGSSINKLRWNYYDYYRNNQTLRRRGRRTTVFSPTIRAPCAYPRIWEISDRDRILGPGLSISNSQSRSVVQFLHPCKLGLRGRPGTTGEPQHAGPRRA